MGDLTKIRKIAAFRHTLILTKLADKYSVPQGAWKYLSLVLYRKKNCIQRFLINCQNSPFFILLESQLAASYEIFRRMNTFLNRKAW